MPMPTRPFYRNDVTIHNPPPAPRGAGDALGVEQNFQLPPALPILTHPANSGEPDATPTRKGTPRKIPDYVPMGNVFAITSRPA